MHELNPLYVEEILEHCLTYLCHSTHDMMACALVSRHWVYAAQSQLYRDPPIRGMLARECPDIHRKWAQFIETLESSPHLIRHVRRLSLKVDKMAGLETVSRICFFPFTHLDSVLLSFGLIWVPYVDAFQQLLSLPSLRRVKLQCNICGWEDFARLWDRCSPTLRHLELGFNHLRSPVVQEPPVSLVDCRGIPVVLESLHLTSKRISHYRFTQPSCPFDISTLKLLRIGHRVEVQLQDFGVAIQNIETLAIVVNVNLRNLSFSAFPKLTSLHIRMLTDSSLLQNDLLLQLLSTIGPTSSIREIIFCSKFSYQSPEFYEHLDAKLSSLPMPHTPIVVCAIGPAAYEYIRSHLPLLSGRDMLRRIDDEVW
ncbi:hypothetical protein MVEN_01089900 [Mycena venus]|uniref:F-box domain-containing protein n=1 Tax=Mycena venus TaxID=2733690 RepID=A0A8H6Y8C4_9AGAR|nr:hypothetical protein MVEN_01089900 [Mycena venus]